MTPVYIAAGVVLIAILAVVAYFLFRKGSGAALPPKVSGSGVQTNDKGQTLSEVVAEQAGGVN